MKNLFFFVFIQILSFPFVLSSQIEITPSLGYNYSTIRELSPNLPNYSFKGNYLVGLQYKIPINNVLKYSTTLQFSNKGFNYFKQKQGETFHYIDLLHQVHFSPILNLSISGGFNTGFQLNKVKTLPDKAFDLGIIFGISYNIDKLTLFTQYNQSLRNLSNEHQSFGNSKNVLRNTNIQFGIGYRFEYFGNYVKKEDQKINKSESNHEIGLKFSGLNSPFNIIYKKEVSPNKYGRIGFFISQINYSFNDNDDNSLNTTIGLSLGYEKRKSLTDKFQFIHGFEPQIGISLSSYSNSSSINPAIGYILGLQYIASPNLSFGFESVPRLSARFENNSFSYSLGSISLDFNPNVQLFGVYRFSK